LHLSQLTKLTYDNFEAPKKVTLVVPLLGMREILRLAPTAGGLLQRHAMGRTVARRSAVV